MTLISIITPVFNREDEILRCISSVSKLKTNKNIDYEHIIVDDGSKDNTIKIIEQIKSKYKIKFFKHKKNKGVNAARNTCIKHAKGDYILLLDSDDEIVQKGLIIIEKTLKKTKKQGFVYEFLTKKNNGKIMGSSKKYGIPISYKEQLQGISKGEFIALVKKEVFDNIKFDENRLAFEGIFWNKVARKFNKIIFINQVVRIYHDDAENRLCKEIQDPKNALQRIKDYTYYLKEFEKDYLKFKLFSKLSDIYFKIGYYYLLSENRQKGKWYINKSNKTKLNIKSTILKIIILTKIISTRQIAYLIKKYS